MCHSYESFTGVTANGDTVNLTVDSSKIGASVHGKAGLRCSECHANITSYPHSEAGQIGCSQCHGTGGGSGQPVTVSLPYESARAMSVALAEGCRRCHEKQSIQTQDSIHMQVFAAGNEQAPVCTDCHGSHDTIKPDQALGQQAEICARCHEAVYTSYRASLHGQALFDQQNPDVPTCTNCHGVHNVQGPRDAEFRDESIAVCGGCHGDEELMAKYGISAEVFQTYLDDFHGRTVNLNRQGESLLPSDQAVCYDCHGVHNILPPDDPNSTVNPANLMSTCAQCHTDANVRFPSAWLGHKNPSFTSTPAMYGVSLFYKVFIPTILGFFAVYIVLDVYRRSSDARAARRGATEQSSSGGAESAPEEPSASPPPQAGEEDRNSDVDHADRN
jgi:predicted CXXCH cytochrome family protein